MDKLFDLSFYASSNEDYEEGFLIGLFATQEEAESVAAHYRREIPGFKDYDCVPRVISFPVIGGENDAKQVYRFQGWNTDENMDEVDIIISSCFVDLMEAENALVLAKERTPREEWVMNCHTIGQCDWREGFERCFGKKTKGE